MSTEAITWALSVHGLSPRAKLVLIGLADSCDKATWTCYPSRKSLAEVGDCSLDTVDRAMKELASAGHIKVDGRMREKGGQSSNLYTVHPSRKIAAPPHNRAPNKQGRKVAEEGAAKLQRAPPAEMPRGEPQGYAAGGAAQGAAPYEPSTEPSYEPTASLRSAVRAKTQRRCTVDPDLLISDGALTFAAERGFVNGTADALWERFKNHHASKGTLFASVEAGWRTWVLNEIKFQGEKHGNGPGGAGNANRAGARTGPRSAATIIMERALADELEDGDFGPPRP